MAAIDHRQNAITNMEPIKDNIYDLEQLLFEATMNLETFRDALQTATTGKQLFEAYKPYVESWAAFVSNMQAIDKQTIEYGRVIDPYLKQLDGK